MIKIRELDAAEAGHYMTALAEVLVDCVNGGASVSFMAGFTREQAGTFFAQTAEAVGRGERILLAAFEGDALIGTVQVIMATPPNQPHRADVAKLLVAQSARARGVGALLMTHAEQAAGGAGKTLLVLDTVTGGSAERLYVRLGWTKAGVIPNYALFPDGRPCDTSIFWKQILERGD